MITTFNLKQLQDENKPWVERNFHIQDRQVALEPLAGMIEEIGELEEAEHAIDYVKVEDSIGDVMVYMADFCGCLDLDLYELGKSPLPLEFAGYLSASEMIILLGKLSHATLKAHQKIRTNEKHMDAIKQLLQGLILHLREVCDNYGFVSLENVCSKVWGEVKERDWKKNKTTGEVRV